MTQMLKQVRTLLTNMGAAWVLATLPRKLDRKALMDTGDNAADWRWVACRRASGIDNISGYVTPQH